MPLAIDGFYAVFISVIFFTHSSSPFLPCHPARAFAWFIDGLNIDENGMSVSALFSPISLRTIYPNLPLKIPLTRCTRTTSGAYIAMKKFLIL